MPSPATDIPTLRFLGGAGTVTGSKHLITAGGRQVLLDCGLFQGLKALRLRNWAPPPLLPAEVDAVVLSHAHIDHSGYLPLLVRNGFCGPILCTPGTADLLRILLLDAAHLQEEEAEIANRYGYSKHHPALPLFTTADAEAALCLVRHHPYGTPVPIAEGLTAILRRAGHILGSATVEVQVGGRRPARLVFSGDLGRWNRPILRDPELVGEADVVLVESTYGDRTHDPDATEAVARVVDEAVARGGALVVPAFAVGRTQELLWILRQLEDEGRIPVLPVFLDSPMAINVTDIYTRHPEDHDLDMRALVEGNRGPFTCRQLRLLRTAEESKTLNTQQGPLIIISASGMATGGRVLHHLKLRLPDPRTTVLLPGFQAAGTRGRTLVEGARTVRIHGQDVPVRATVVTLDGLSAHGDRDDILRWLSGFTTRPRAAYVVHGEAAQAEALATAIRARLGWDTNVARDGEVVSISR
jgi:metallo-beta-lactamase family protein